MRITNCIAIVVLAIAPAACGLPKLPVPESRLLDPKGDFTLVVTNQSFAIDPVDVRVEIDGELVVSDYFRVGSQHTFVPFQLALGKGTHKIRVWSERGATDLVQNFDLTTEDIGVIEFWYYPKSHHPPTPQMFRFSVQKGPLRVI
jgi:hypothetical protein